MSNTTKRRWDPRTTYHRDDKFHLTHPSKHESLSLSDGFKTVPIRIDGPFAALYLFFRS